jgi:hypothetical protein
MAGVVPAIHGLISCLHELAVVPGALQHEVMLRRTGTSFVAK